MPITPPAHLTNLLLSGSEDLKGVNIEEFPHIYSMDFDYFYKKIHPMGRSKLNIERELVKKMLPESFGMAGRVLAVCFLSILFACGGSEGKKGVAHLQAIPLSEIPVIFDGRPRAGWDVTNFGPQGPVTVTPQEIVLGMGDGCTGITWRGEFPVNNYQVDLDARRIAGTDFFCGITFPVGKDPCSLIVGGWGGTTVGLSNIDKEDAYHNKTRISMSFDKEKWYHIRLTVTAERIKAWIDTTRVVDFNIDGHRLSIRPEVELSRPFGIASWNTTAGIKNVVVSSNGN
jgi:hypothetical protein